MLLHLARQFCNQILRREGLAAGSPFGVRNTSCGKNFRDRIYPYTRDIDVENSHIDPFRPRGL
jgi:hypothetical protein